MPHVATLWDRFRALLIDYLCIVGYGVVLLAVNLLVFLVLLDGFPTFDELGMNLISLTMIVPVVLLSIMCEAGGRHATPGKVKARIVVASARGRPLRAWQVVVRNIVKFLPWQLAHMAIFRGFACDWVLPPIWMAFLIAVDVLPCIWVASLLRKDHRGIHDLVARTVVVKRASLA